MFKRVFLLVMISFILTLLFSCQANDGNEKVKKVGMLVEESVDGNDWDMLTHQGLLTIKEEFDIPIYIKENIQTKMEIKNAISELINEGVNLIFGNTKIYGRTFVEVAQEYPHIHFVYFNGGHFGENVTSLNFNSHAMGFFGGMVAGEMTETNHVGIIGVYNSQSEIEGFYEGIKYKNPEVKVHIELVNNWYEVNKPVLIYEEMKEKGTDIFYPAGGSFSENIIQQAATDDLYVVGYLYDQSILGEETVVTSTIKNVVYLYKQVVNKFNKQTLNGGILSFDFQDDAISLGKFGPNVPKNFQNKINKQIIEYKETNRLPNEY